MVAGGKKKRKYHRKNPSNKIHRSPRIKIKNFEIFVTDFLTDPCGLPVELRDCILIDGTTSLNNATDICTANNSQVLKNIFGNIESIKKTAKKLNEFEQRINI